MADDFNYYEDLKQGLAEALAYKKRGEKGRCRVHVLKTVIPSYTSKEIRSLRVKLNLSQLGLAAALGVSKRTVEAWEANRNTPNGAARHLIYLIQKEPELINRLIQRD